MSRGDIERHAEPACSESEPPQCRADIQPSEASLHPGAPTDDELQNWWGWYYDRRSPAEAVRYIEHPPVD